MTLLSRNQKKRFWEGKREVGEEEELFLNFSHHKMGKKKVLQILVFDLKSIELFSTPHPSKSV